LVLKHGVNIIRVSFEFGKVSTFAVKLLFSISNVKYAFIVVFRPYFEELAILKASWANGRG